MKYTREQAEAVLRDLRTYHEMGNDLHPSDIKFLNAKFPTIEVGKWYKTNFNNALFVCITKKKNKHYDGFGFTGFGQWFSCGYACGDDDRMTPATEQEVLDRLTEEAKKRYKVGDRVKSMKSSTELCVFSNDVVELEDNYFLVSGISVLNLSTGEWAEVVESNPIHDKIEALERKLAELKELIKIK
jgi:hypothetical protein